MLILFIRTDEDWGKRAAFQEADNTHKMFMVNNCLENLGFSLVFRTHWKIGEIIGVAFLQIVGGRVIHTLGGCGMY